MISVLIQMTALILCGVGWRLFRPSGLGADQARLVLTNVVYYLMLPALILSVMWDASLGIESLKISFLASATVLFAIAITWLVLRRWAIEKSQLGALIIAASFPNITYLGLPILEQTFGGWARSIAIQFDLFACTPLLLTVGVLIARHYGSGEKGEIFFSLLKVPPLWAGLFAVTMNVQGIPQPDWLGGFLGLLSPSVVPLMLIALGMGLRIDSLHWRTLPKVLPVILVQLILMPLFGWALAVPLGISGELLVASVLETAMPSMVLGLVLCDRYKLDGALYAMAVTVTTCLSLFTLPFCYELLT